PGGIYLSGTDQGRLIVAALCKSDALGDPFFIVSQNALAHGPSLAFLGRCYEKQFHTPSGDDAQRAFNEYLADVQRRFDHDRRFPDQPQQLNPSEAAQIVNNRAQVSGEVAATAINARLAHLIFQKNPEREFYVDDAFSHGWMYPHL